MWVALEHYLKRDHEKDWREWEERVRVMTSGLAAARGVSTEKFVPEIANQVPHLRTRWDPSVVKISHAEAIRQLREGRALHRAGSRFVREGHSGIRHLDVSTGRSRSRHPQAQGDSEGLVVIGWQDTV